MLCSHVFGVLTGGKRGSVGHKHVVSGALLFLSLELDLQLLLKLGHFALESHLVDGSEVFLDEVVVHLAVCADVQEDHRDYH